MSIEHCDYNNFFLWQNVNEEIERTRSNKIVEGFLSLIDPEQVYYCFILNIFQILAYSIFSIVRS